FAPYDLEDALLMWTNTCVLQLTDEYTSQQQQQQPSKASNKHLPSTPPIMPLFLETWSELDNFCKDFRDGRGLNAIAVYYEIGGESSIDPYKVYPRRRGDGSGGKSTFSPTSAHLTLAYRTANLTTFERACIIGGISPPPWKPEELARAEGNISRVGSANVSIGGKKVETDSNSASTAFRSCLQAFLCELFMTCHKLSSQLKPARPESKRALKISRKHLKEVSLSSSKESSRPDTALIPVAAEDSFKVAVTKEAPYLLGVVEPELACMTEIPAVCDSTIGFSEQNNENAIQDDNFMESESVLIPVDEEVTVNMGAIRASIQPLLNPNEESVSITLAQVSEPENALNSFGEIAIQKMEITATDEHTTEIFKIHKTGNENSEQICDNLEYTISMEALEQGSVAESTADIQNPINTAILEDVVDKDFKLSRISKKLPKPKKKSDQDGLPPPPIPRPKPTQSELLLPSIVPETIDASSLQKNHSNKKAKSKPTHTTKLPEIFKHPHQPKPKSKEEATSKPLLKLPTLVPSLPPQPATTTAEDATFQSTTVSHLSEPPIPPKHSLHNKHLQSRFGDSPPANSCKPINLTTKALEKEGEEDKEEERQQETSFAHSLHREFILEKQNPENLSPTCHQQNATAKTSRLRQPNTRNKDCCEFPLHKVEPAHFIFVGQDKPVTELDADDDDTDDAEKPISAPEFDVDAALQDDDDGDVDHLSAEEEDCLKELCAGAVRVTFASSVGIEIESVGDDKIVESITKKRWHRPATGPHKEVGCTEAGAQEKQDETNDRNEDGYQDSSEYSEEDDEYDDIEESSNRIVNAKGDIPVSNRSSKYLKSRKAIRRPVRVTRTSKVEVKENADITILSAGPTPRQHKQQEQNHDTAAKSRISTGLMTFPIPESSEAEFTQQQTQIDQLNQDAWERSKSKICQLKQKKSKARGLTEPSSTVRKDSTLVSAKQRTEAERIEKLAKETRAKSADAKVAKELEQNELRRQREIEQMELIASRSRLRAAQRAAEKEMALAAARASSTISHVSSNSLKMATTAINTTQITSTVAAGTPLKKKKGLPTPVQQSNRKIIKNALQVCLAGTVNEKVKKEVLEDLDASSAHHFIILFRGLKNHAFKGLYSYDANLHQVLRVYAPASLAIASSNDLPKPSTPTTPTSSIVGPNTLTEQDVLEFYKYDSGSRSFKVVPTRSFGASVHAVAVRSEYGRKAMM
ncbi:UNVERIFIED_CONTAM: hypothetical protein HDU68_003204, partial [Siphonaria sp. JEL0065]